MKRKIEFDKGSNQFQGPILDWYYTLRSTRIRNLELHQTLGPADSYLPTVVISLVDGSKYGLYRTVSITKTTILPEFVDSIEHVSLSDVVAQPLLRIQFNEDQGPDLLYVLSVCYGAQTHEPIFTAPRIVTDSDFFALALILNITQKCLPERVIAQTSTESPLELLWKDVYMLVQSQGYAFWADTVADHTKHMTRELVCKATQSALVHHISGVDPDENLLYAAAAVARVEAMAERRKMGGPAVWDKAWNHQWKLVWQDFRPATRHRRISIVAKIFGGMPNETPKLAIDGRIPGRVAGRSPMKFRLSSGSIEVLKAISPSLQLFSSGPDPEAKERVRSQDLSDNYKGRSQATSHDQSQVTTNQVSPSTNASNPGASILWLGHGHLNSRDGDNELWAVPREVAVEMAWAEAWPRAVEQGRIAARAIQELERRNKFLAESQSSNQPTNVRTRRNTMHPGLENIISAARTTGRLISQASRKYSTRKPKPQKSSVKDTSAAQAQARVAPKTPLPASPGTRAENNSRPVRPNQPPGPGSGTIPFPTLPPIPSSPQLPSSPPTTSRRVSFSEADASTRPRNRSETQAKRVNTLRKHVISRRSDTRRDSNLKEIAAFNSAVRERRHREKKEDARETAKKVMSPMVGQTVLPDARLEELAEEALNRAKELSSNIEHSVKQLAKKEWEQLSRGRSFVTSPFLQVDPTAWEQGFVRHWERAWKESWMAAWRDVWDQAWDAAVARGVEFGVDEILDKDASASRTNYEQLRSGESFLNIKDNIEDKKLDQLGRLDLVHSMMKELYSLHDLLRHSIPSIQDDSMEIRHQVKRTKATGPNGVTGKDWEKLTYFQLHQWVEHEFIYEKFKADPELKESLKRLFIRGISEVWESASSVYREKNISSGDKEDLSNPVSDC